MFGESVFCHFNAACCLYTFWPQFLKSGFEQFLFNPMFLCKVYYNYLCLLKGAMSSIFSIISKPKLVKNDLF